MTGIDRERHQAAVRDALIYKILGDVERTLDAIEEIVDAGPAGVHAALFAWSTLTLQGFAEDQGVPQASDGNHYWVTVVENARTGETVSIDQVPDPATVNAFKPSGVTRKR